MITPEALSQYRTLILPECSFLTSAQADAMTGFLNRGRHVLATGDLGLNLPDDVRRDLLAHPLMLRATQIRPDDLAGGPQIICASDADMAIHIHKIGDRQAAIHMIRYDYDEVPVIPKMTLDVRLARPFRMAKTFSPVGEVGVHMGVRRDIREMHSIDLTNVPLYSVIMLQG
jgi:hypothetical protein